MISMSASAMYRRARPSRSLVQALLIEHHVGLHDAAAVTAGHALGLQNVVQAVELPALLAVVPVDAAVKLQDLPAAGGLMETVDVLGDDGPQLALRPPTPPAFGGRRWVWHRGPASWPGRNGKILPACFHRSVWLKIVSGGYFHSWWYRPSSAAEVRDAALSGDSGPAEKDDIVAAVHHFLAAASILSSMRRPPFVSLFYHCPQEVSL